MIFVGRKECKPHRRGLVSLPLFLQMSQICRAIPFVLDSRSKCMKHNVHRPYYPSDKQRRRVDTSTETPTGDRRSLPNITELFLPLILVFCEPLTHLKKG